MFFNTIQDLEDKIEETSKNVRQNVKELENGREKIRSLRGLIKEV